MIYNSIERRVIFERTRAKFLDAGLGFEDDPLFLEWVESWIAATMTLAELRSRYVRLLADRGAKSKR
jgi:hypothetical protein